MEGRTEFLEMQEHALEVLRKAEEAALEAGRKWASTVGEFVPMEMPLARQLVTDALNFTEEVLRLQREFVHGVVGAFHEALPKPPAARRTPKRAAATHTPRPAARPVSKAS